MAEMIMTVDDETVIDYYIFFSIVAASIGNRERKDAYEAKRRQLRKGKVLVAECEYYGIREPKYHDVEDFSDYAYYLDKVEDYEDPLYSAKLRVMNESSFEDEPS